MPATLTLATAEELDALRQEVAELRAGRRESAEAEQAALQQVYTVETLAKRLHISPRSARTLLHNGDIGFFYAGQKNYRISERAVRRFEDGLPPLAIAA